MNITSEFLADLLIGIARAQNAVIDAVERANPGFRNTHAVPLITVAANMRAGDPRMIDLPSRILLRLQGRVALDNAQVKADIERLASGEKTPAVAFTPPTTRAPTAAAARAAPAAAAPSAAPAKATPAAPTPPATSGGSELDFSAKS